MFVEVGIQQRRKHGQNICGDAFVSHKYADQNRVISVLSDGLGSGVKANILSTMTVAMAAKFTESGLDFVRCAKIMMDALPVCQKRMISYATFTIVDCRMHGATRIIEMDSPPVLLVRRGQAVACPSTTIESPREDKRILRFTEVTLEPEDRLVFCTDGITQAGLGTRSYPLGWREDGVEDYVLDQVRATPSVSARDLSEALLQEALRKEHFRRAQDDMSAAVVYFRRPRKLLMLTGPPFLKERDAEYARLLDQFDGKRVVCGGTTANIVARELDRPINMILRGGDRVLPPISEMAGVDLITEGILTLTRAAQLIEADTIPPDTDPAAQLVHLLLESDMIQFVVGSRINEAHQDPSLPVDIEIRRNIVKRIAHVLEERHLKEVTVSCI